MLRGRPTAFANSSSMWIGLKSPGGARVAVRQVLVGRDAQLGDRVPDVQIAHLRLP